MAFSVVMPALEMAQETGKLVSWLKKEGDSVSKGEPLLEIETDKAVMEIEAPGDGILAGIKVLAGAEVPVGQTIAWIVRPGEAPPGEEVRVETGRKTTKASTAPAAAVSSSVAAASGKPIRISPKARRLAAEEAIDVSSVRGSGPDGEILADDILKAATAATAASATSAAAASTFARLMAEKTLQSWTTVPHFFLVREMDAGALSDSRAELSAKNSGASKITYTDLLVALVARVLVRHSRLNAGSTAEGARENREVNISLAIATPDAVVAPVIHNAHTASLAEIAARRHELTERVRAGKLQPSDIKGGTFTISNLGMLDVDAFTAIITPPQVAILALGRIADRVVAVDGKSAVRPMITMTLSSDHRVVSGAHAAEFMRDLAAAIGNPLPVLR
jgi:pyruvate dehydrogenase E2 component (dihydrolipoamide acetyltransferase)